MATYLHQTSSHRWQRHTHAIQFEVISEIQSVVTNFSRLVLFLLPEFHIRDTSQICMIQNYVSMLPDGQWQGEMEFSALFFMFFFKHKAISSHTFHKQSLHNCLQLSMCKLPPSCCRTCYNNNLISYMFYNISSTWYLYYDIWFIKISYISYINISIYLYYDVP